MSKQEERERVLQMMRDIGWSWMGPAMTINDVLWVRAIVRRIGA